MSVPLSKEVKTVPWSETIMGAFRFIENPIPVVSEAMDRYGSTYYTRLIGGTKIVMTSDPIVVKHILQKNNKNYIKSELQTVQLGQYVGKGLLTVNGSFWLRQRRLIQPGFHKDRLSNLLEIMNAEAMQFVKEWKGRIEQGKTDYDIAHEMMELTLRIVSKSLFSTGITAAQVDFLGHSFEALQRHIVKEVRLPLFKFWRRLNGSHDNAMKLADTVKDLMRNIIDERKALPMNERPDDLLTMLLEARYEDTNEPMEMQQLLDELIIIFVAGHETTANTLAWTIYSLSQNPEYIPQIQKDNEVIQYQNLSMDALARAKNTENILNESMRKYPPAWIIDRMALNDDFVNGINISKGDLIGIYTYGLHNKSELWAEPELFKPERFKERTSNTNYHFIPFGGGPRLCIGNHFAMMEMKLSLFHLFNDLNFDYDSSKVIEFEPLVTLRPKGGISMMVSPN